MIGFWHWVDIEYWAQSWPNIFAPSAWTLLGISISHAHMVWLHNKHHNELMGRTK